MTITVTLYTRKDCSLCEQAKADLEAIQSQIPHRLVEIDVDIDSALREKYLAEVPVVEVGPYKLKTAFTKADLLMSLGAARDRKDHLEQIADPAYQRRVERGQVISRADRASMWFSHHWLAAVNLLIFMYVGLPFLAPVLMKVGATLPANIIYAAYSPLCHQLGFRSFFLFGEQPYYPRAAAGIAGAITFNQATGINEDDLLAARGYIGDAKVGYKVAVCQRDVAIYLSIIVFGLFFAATRRRLKPLHFVLWVAIGIFPIGLDGFSQLFSQLNLPLINAILPYRESTPFLRVLTGALFGFCTAWFGLPYVEESMRETREILIRKFMVIDNRKSQVPSGHDVDNQQS
ncbi:MAG: DUF2085 domain-containing protein [Anaerolineales bacterium]